MPTTPDSNPRCLLVTKEFSATPTSGGTLRTLALTEQLATRYDTTVISPDGVLRMGPDTALTPEPAAESVAAGAGASGGGSPLRRLGTMPRYRSISGVRTAGIGLLDNLQRAARGRYDVGVIDHTCLAGLADELASGCDRLVLSMHNVESDLMAQRAAAATSIGSGLVMRAETELLRRLEAHVVARYPVVVCTEADARALGATRGAIVCRNGIFAGPVPAALGSGQRRPDSMVFSGALDWEPNVAGLLWFVAQVWPLVREKVPTATVTIAGRNPGQVVTEACAVPGVRLLANPPVMATVLDQHLLGIVPLLSGGGSRIKILEYLAAGIDIVSTDVGASGLEDIPDELLDRLPADPRLFADSLVRRLDALRVTGPGPHPDSGSSSAQDAQDWVREHYSWNVTLRPLLDFLRG